MIEDLISQDHERIINSYFQYKLTKSQNEAEESFNNVIKDICKLFIAEEVTLFPLINKIPELEGKLVKELIEEHDEIKNILNELYNNSTYQFFNETFEILMEDIMNHFLREEKELYPVIKQHISKTLENEIYDLFNKRNNIIEKDLRCMLTNKSQDYNSYFT